MPTTGAIQREPAQRCSRYLTWHSRHASRCRSDLSIAFSRRSQPLGPLLPLRSPVSQQVLWAASSEAPQLLDGSLQCKTAAIPAGTHRSHLCQRLDPRYHTCGEALVMSADSRLLPDSMTCSKDLQLWRLPAQFLIMVAAQQQICLEAVLGAAILLQVITTAIWSFLASRTCIAAALVIMVTEASVVTAKPCPVRIKLMSKSRDNMACHRVPAVTATCWLAFCAGCRARSGEVPPSCAVHSK